MNLGRILVALAISPVASVLAGCGGTRETLPDSAGGSSHAAGASGQAGTSSSGGSAQGGSAGTGTGGSGGATCENFAPPPYDKSCSSDADCFAGIHTSDCCGSKQVVGYSVAEEARFTSYEMDCTARAVCRCAAGPPALESGQVASDLELRFATCITGQCFGSGPVNTGAP